MNSPQTRSLLGKLTGLHIQSLLDTEAKPEYRQNEPALKVKMTRMGGEVLIYHFSKPEDASYYVLKRSDLECRLAPCRGQSSLEVVAPACYR